MPLTPDDAVHRRKLPLHRMFLMHRIVSNTDEGYRYKECPSYTGWCCIQRSDTIIMYAPHKQYDIAYKGKLPTYTGTQVIPNYYIGIKQLTGLVTMVIA